MKFSRIKSSSKICSTASRSVEKEDNKLHTQKNEGVDGRRKKGRPQQQQTKKSTPAKRFATSDLTNLNSSDLKSWLWVVVIVVDVVAAAAAAAVIDAVICLFQFKTSTSEFYFL